MPKTRTRQARLYRFHNVEVDKYGDPFAMCDKCKESYRPPANCIMNKIADKAVEGCRHGLEKPRPEGGKP